MQTPTPISAVLVVLTTLSGLVSTPQALPTPDTTPQLVLEAQAGPDTYIPTQPAPSPIFDAPALNDRTEVEREVELVFKEDTRTAERIVTCESHWNAKARNKTSSATGLFQILADTHGYTRDELEDPITNIHAAHKLYLRSGFQPWASSRHCWAGGGE